MRTFLSLLFCLFSLTGFNQGIINNYVYGYDNWPKAILNFPNNQPTTFIDSSITMRSSYTHSNISDSAGNLLFYTNGVVVMDGNHDTMPNGRGLNPCLNTTQFQYAGLNQEQATLIIPIPHQSGVYYMFHQGLDYYSIGIYAASQTYYSVIDMNMNNGFGDLILKNVSFVLDTFCGSMITACKHANGRDWWIVLPVKYTHEYYFYLLDPAGLHFFNKQQIGSRYYQGQSAFSPDGSHYGYYDYYDGMEIFDFDRCSGSFSNPRYVNVNDSSWGLGFCFSPDSKLAYAANAIYLYQFNLDSADLITGMQVVASWDSTYDSIFGPPVAATFEFMQIGPNGKIYMTTVWSTHYMQFINNPDSIGLASDMQQHSIPLPTPNGNTMPNFINYFLGPVVGSVCDSLGLGVPENAVHNFKFTIQPNPIIDKTLHCKYVLPQNKAGTLELLDLTGRFLHKEPLPEWSTEQNIKLTVSPGIYLVKLKSNHQQVVKKIVVP